MNTVTTIAGQTLTVGTVASFLAQYVKTREWFPVRFRATLVRLMVASVCVLINGAVAYAQGGLDAEALVNAFFSYVIAAAAYDHLFS